MFKALITPTGDQLNLYLKLEAYPEVEKILTILKERGFKTGILSNGSDAMLESAVKNAKIENLKRVGIWTDIRLEIDLTPVSSLI